MKVHCKKKMRKSSSNQSVKIQECSQFFKIEASSMIQAHMNTDFEEARGLAIAQMMKIEKALKISVNTELLKKNLFDQNITKGIFENQQIQMLIPSVKSDETNEDKSYELKYLLSLDDEPLDQRGQLFPLAGEESSWL